MSPCQNRSEGLLSGIGFSNRGPSLRSIHGVAIADCLSSVGAGSPSICSKAQEEEQQEAEEEQAELVVAPPSTPEAPAGAPEQFFVELAKAIRQVETTPSVPSPLTIQRELKEAVDSGFLLATEQVAQIFGMKKSTITSWKTGHKKYGFVFTKVKEGSATLWKVGQY